MPPEISIITPCLDPGGYLAQTLSSVATQTDVAVEHLIFDPGSTDGARGILRDYANRAPHARIFFEHDAGAAQAINSGFARAQGEVVGWLCSDDFYASAGALRAVLQAFARHPECDIVYGRSAFVDATGARLGDGPFLANADSALWTLQVSEPFLQPAAFFRRALIERIGMLDPDYRLAFDYEFWLRAACAGVTFQAIEFDIARKRRHPEAVSSLLPGVRYMECARATRGLLGKASGTWVEKAIAADVLGEAPAPRPASAARAAMSAAAGAAVRGLNRGRPDLLVVLGNGPSMSGFDFDELRELDAIGMNAAYRYWREIRWFPRYYACLDTVVGLSHRAEIEAMLLQADLLGIDAFLLRDNLIQQFSKAARQSPRLINFDRISGPGSLLDQVPLTTGSHAALFGALLGYRRMLLLGIDCNYVEGMPGAKARQGTVLELAETPQDNPNYFFQGYQIAGDRYNVPNPVPDMHLNCWRAVGARLAGRGIEVWNGSAISRLDVFAQRPFSQVKSELAAATGAGDTHMVESGLARRNSIWARPAEFLRHAVAAVAMRRYLFAATALALAGSVGLALMAYALVRSAALAAACGVAAAIIGLGAILVARVVWSVRQLHREFASVKREAELLRSRLALAERRLARFSIRIDAREGDDGDPLRPSDRT